MLRIAYYAQYTMHFAYNTMFIMLCIEVEDYAKERYAIILCQECYAKNYVLCIMYRIL